jgi:H+-transporting ATPase
MPPLGWSYAALVWGYALFWFVVEDQVKLAAYRVFDRTKPALLGKGAGAKSAMVPAERPAGS